MKRLAAMLAAAALLGGPLAMGGAALAREHGDRGGERRAEHSESRGGEARGRGDERGGGRGDYGDPRGYGGPQVYAPRPAPQYPPYAPRYAPQYEPPYAPAPTPRARRGGYLAPEAGGAVPDYGRYRLRQPPRGYAWVRTANGYAMVSIASGQVFDVVPY